MSGATLGNAYVQIIPSANGIKGSITDALAGESANAGKASGKAIGGTLTSSLKGMIGTAAIGKALMTTITEGAKLEQSLGGIETLFKGSAGKMKAYAEQAYKTAGVSANTYMENVTSFSASLIKSTGGDTEKAAEVANQAMIDMGDNANKMGTDMQSIQNAYQGFAKQNYTMLDNLKLGYGGTKSEMERLLADAEKISGQKYDISNLDDVYNAIHVIQEDLDITGTTAKEAATTLSGSFGSMKAAAQDFLGQLTIGGDIKQPMMNLVTTASTFLFDNLIPALANIMAQLPAAIGQLLVSAVPSILQNLTKVFNDLRAGIEGTGSSEIFEAGNKILADVCSAIVEYGPDLLVAFGQLMASISASLGGLIVQCITDVLAGIAGTIMSAFKAAGAEAVNTFVAPFQGMGAELTKVWKGIKASASTLWKGIKIAITLPISGARASIKVYTAAIKAAFNALKSIKSTVSSVFKSAKSAMTRPIKEAYDYIKSIPGKIKSAFKNLKISLPKPSLSPSIKWVKFGKGKVSVSLPSISFNKAGGIFTKATLLGGNNVVGEAGAEAVLPLKTLWSKMDSIMAKNMTGGNNVTVTMTVNGAENPEQWGARFAKELQRQMRMA